MAKSILLMLFIVFISFTNAGEDNYQVMEIGMNDLGSTYSIKLPKIDLDHNLYNHGVIIINDTNCPVNINSAKVSHINSEVANAAKAIWDNLFRYLTDTEKESVKQYLSEKLIVSIDAVGEEATAVKFGIVVYDSFKEYLGGLTAIFMDPPTKEMVWDYRPVYLFKFKRYGVMGVFVKQVRLKNGEIWNFNALGISNKLTKAYSKVATTQLSEKVE